MFEFYAYPGWRSIHGGPQDDSSPGGYTANRIGKKTGGWTQWHRRSIQESILHRCICSCEAFCTNKKGFSADRVDLDHDGVYLRMFGSGLWRTRVVLQMTKKSTKKLFGQRKSFDEICTLEVKEVPVFPRKFTINSALVTVQSSIPDQAAKFKTQMGVAFMKATQKTGSVRLVFGWRGLLGLRQVAAEQTWMNLKEMKVEWHGQARLMNIFTKDFFQAFLAWPQPS